MYIKKDSFDGLIILMDGALNCSLGSEIGRSERCDFSKWLGNIPFPIYTIIYGVETRRGEE